MITNAALSYIALRQATGYVFKTGGGLIQSFARFAAERGDTHVRTATAVDWAILAPSPRQKERRLQAVIGFARYAHADDSRNEVPSAGIFAGNSRRRPTPFIFSPAQVRTLLDAAQRLGPEGAFRPLLYQTLFGLLAATGMRISEALALRRGDVSTDGILIRKTKFRKARLLPVQDSTTRAIEVYWDRRRRMAGDHLFDNGRGGPLVYATADYTFKQLIRIAGVVVRCPDHPRPHIHSLRHTFAVRALESCPLDRAKVDRHVLALSTYLGHVHLACTYWYLEATPQLMRSIAHQVEANFCGDCL